jgi:hypothetical protein
VKATLMMGTADHTPTGNPHHATDSATSHGPSVAESSPLLLPPLPPPPSSPPSSARELFGAAASSKTTRKAANKVAASATEEAYLSESNVRSKLSGSSTQSPKLPQTAARAAVLPPPRKLWSPSTRTTRPVSAPTKQSPASTT